MPFSVKVRTAVKDILPVIKHIDTEVYDISPQYDLKRGVRS